MRSRPGYISPETWALLERLREETAQEEREIEELERELARPRGLLGWLGLEMASP